ncbi:MAG: TOBE domain-containing protein [Methanobrevibacter sp.]|jgi:molybdate transport system regulatory protein|nr:TOBE domain-containing protein [Candidatus Methanovirga procula]
MFHSTYRSSKELKVSYKTALNYIEDIEKGLDIKLVITNKGGKGGGGSTFLSSDGEKILKECKALNAMIELNNGINEIETIITHVDKDNGIMEIEISDNIITLPRKNNYSVGDKVLALISYDNIFITLEPYKSSVRNILKGTITEMQLIDNLFRIKVNVGNIGVYSDITKFASTDLKLELGKEVYVGFKAMSIALLKL